MYHTPETKCNPNDDRGRFSIVPDWLICAVSPGAVQMYALLGRFADRTTGQCWPSHAKLAELLGVSTRTVITRINELIDAGAVTSTKQYRSDGSQTSNLYILHDRQHGEATDDETEPRREEPVQAEPTSNVSFTTPVQTNAHRCQNPFTPRTRTIELEPLKLKPLIISDLDFESFWSRYPRKIGKLPARKAWEKAIKKRRPDEIISALEAQLSSMLKRDRNFILHAATWLNQERWDDEVEIEIPSHLRAIYELRIQDGLPV